MLKDAIPFTDSQQIPVIRIKQGNSASGYWSLWHLVVRNQFETSQVIQPIFISTAGENFSSFAHTVWDKLIQENDFFDCTGVLPVEVSKQAFSENANKAEEMLQVKYEEFENTILQNTATVKANKEKSFVFQEKQLKRIGIENIKQSRLNRLHKESEIWAETFLSSSQIVPSLSCLLMLNIVNE
jgi:hypothetical protein